MNVLSLHSRMVGGLVDWTEGDAGQAKPSFRQYYADCRTDIDQNKSISFYNLHI